MVLLGGRSVRALAVGTLMFGGLTTVSVAASTTLGVGPAGATTATLFSSSTAGSYSVVVPNGVTSVAVTAVGGSGSAASNGVGVVWPGGEGAIITSNVNVTSGELLVATVAANGNDGGAGVGNGGTGGSGSGGGGSAAFGEGSYLVVAGGGGGASNNGPGGNADQAGGGPFAGGPGTLNGPGEGAQFGPHMSSSSGDGMNGGGGGVNDNAGGGGGYFGGGAGFAGGGGGGSSYPTPATEWDATATPSLTITTSDTISLHNARTGRITCTALSGNTTSTITVSGCTGGNTGGSSVSMPATILTGGGTINWLSGGSTTIGIPTLSATSATKCPGYARKAASNPTAETFAASVTGDTGDGILIPGIERGAVCIGTDNSITIKTSTEILVDREFHRLHHDYRNREHCGIWVQRGQYRRRLADDALNHPDRRWNDQLAVWW